MVILEENFKWHLEAFASELASYTHTNTHTHTFFHNFNTAIVVIVVLKTYNCTKQF